MSGFFLKKNVKIFCLCSEIVLSLFQQTKKAHYYEKVHHPYKIRLELRRYGY